MNDSNCKFYKAFPIPKTIFAQNHKNICVLQTKSMASANIQLKIDTGSMYILNKNPKNQNVVKEHSFFPHPFSPKTTKSVFSSQNSKVTEKIEKKPNSLLEKIACLLEKNKSENVLHHQNFKRRKQARRFPTLEKEKFDLSTDTSLKVAKLSPLAVKNLFSTNTTVKLMKNKSLIPPLYVQPVLNQTLEVSEIFQKEQERKNTNGEKKIEIKRKIIRSMQKTIGNLEIITKKHNKTMGNSEIVTKNLDTFFDGTKDENPDQVEDFVAYVRKSKEFS